MVFRRSPVPLQSEEDGESSHDDSTLEELLLVSVWDGKHRSREYEGVNNPRVFGVNHFVV